MAALDRLVARHGYCSREICLLTSFTGSVGGFALGKGWDKDKYVPNTWTTKKREKNSDID